MGVGGGCLGDWVGDGVGLGGGGVKKKNPPPKKKKK